MTNHSNLITQYNTMLPVRFLDAMVELPALSLLPAYSNAFKPTLNFKLTLSVDTALIPVALPFFSFLVVVIFPSKPPL